MKLYFVPFRSFDGVHLLSSSFNNTVGHVLERFVARLCFSAGGPANGSTRNLCMEETLR